MDGNCCSRVGPLTDKIIIVSTMFTSHFGNPDIRALAIDTISTSNLHLTPPDDNHYEDHGHEENEIPRLPSFRDENTGDVRSKKKRCILRAQTREDIQAQELPRRSMRRRTMLLKSSLLSPFERAVCGCMVASGSCSQGSCSLFHSSCRLNEDVITMSSSSLSLCLAF